MCKYVGMYMCVQVPEEAGGIDPLTAAVRSSYGSLGTGSGN